VTSDILGWDIVMRGETRIETLRQRASRATALASPLKASAQPAVTFYAFKAFVIAAGEWHGQFNRVGRRGRLVN
jgi:hypothetical protein